MSCKGLVIVFLVIAGPLQAAEFEVASVRPVTTIPRDPAFLISRTRFRDEVASLKFLIEKAYDLEDYQLIGPDWLATARFDIDAQPPAGSSFNDIPSMLQSLLEQRFHLKTHREIRPQTVYVLRVATTGSRLKEAAADNSIDPAFMKDRELLYNIGSNDGGHWTITRLRSDPNGPLLFDAPRMTTADFARFLPDYAGYPVVDQTGLDGPFHITLPVPRISHRPGADNGPAFVDTLDFIKTLGLRLQKEVLPVEHLVVDSVDKLPTDN
ncbi:MAG TPA: TIGR03435 family protein [Bryobacteraceae bacterium]|nr:TIGR03435 family protein [Bryobacteraceae bacterium]